jgi:predicted O-linked N-acetylglucosamine transferase (SPINDLY family)
VQPAKLQQLLQAAATHLQAGRLDAAAAWCGQARAAAPREFAVQHLSGLVALRSGRAGEAVEFLTAARRLQPRAPSTLMCLGLAWNALGRPADAEAILREAARLAPGAHDIQSNLGAVLVTLNRIEEAVACFRRAVELKPDYAAGWSGLGSALLLAGRAGEAIGPHTRALELDPKHPKARFNRAQAHLACHRVAEALMDFDAQLAFDPDHHEARSQRLFLLNYLDTESRAALFAEHRTYGRAIERGTGYAEARFLPASEPDRRLRVAFLSPDLRQHSIAYFLEPLLRHLDRTEFEVWLYHDHYCVDAVSDRLRGLAAGWRNFVGQPADAVEAAIRGDAPDILVDLAGHTGLNRLPLFARRLAPVQVTYLGYPNTTGLAEMDCRFSDAVADPEVAAELWHTEEIVRFAPTAWTYAPPAELPALPPLPCADGGPVTFGSFNALSKVTSTTLNLWRDVLAAVPNSRLLLKSFGLDAPACLSRLAAHGIAPERVSLLPPTRTVAEHLACYAQMDVALDPFPYGGTTTTCEALWMGRPVITLCGDRHASRVGASLLTAIGHPEWIAAEPADYPRLAADLVRDRSRLSDISRSLRAQAATSPLGDHAGQARRFGQALRDCWQKRCTPAATAPAAMAV